MIDFNTISVNSLQIVNSLTKRISWRQLTVYGMVTITNTNVDEVFIFGGNSNTIAFLGSIVNNVTIDQHHITNTLGFYPF
jgi:hypothetical protein